MKSTDNTIQGKYFQEASILLAHEGFDTHAGDGELLQFSFHGNPLCEITKNGGTRYRHEDVSTDVMSDALEKATSVAATAAEYMKLMENAPPLKASSLDAPYKLLADFNGYVLGGMESGHGVQLTTWQWTYDKDGLTLGHYFGNDYAAAKHDFALRSGLVQEQEQFTPEQLIEIYSIYRYHITKNHYENSNYTIEGYHERDMDISQSLQRRLVDNGMPDTQLQSFLRKEVETA